MKKSIFCLFIFTVFTHVLHAQDCGDLHNNETVRIDQPGGSLENFRVQDQDGVGTCYANAASLLLQSKIEGHPEVSYLHLASMYKSEKLEKDKAEAKISGNYDVYAKAEIDPHKAVVPGADSMKWSLGIDGGFSCEVIDNAIKAQKNKKAPVLCSRKGMNLEKLLGNGDRSQGQFKTILETSKYMNLFQQSFKELDEKETFFNRRKQRLAIKKYEDFKAAFSSLIEQKKKSLTEKECKTFNPGGMDNFYRPALQSALGYGTCLEAENVGSYWCKSVMAMVVNPRKEGEYALEIDGFNPLVTQKIQAKMMTHKNNFTPELIKKDFIDSVVESANLTNSEKPSAANYMEEIFKAMPKERINDLVAEFDEIQTNGFSEKCVERSLANYLAGVDFEKDWKNDQLLCENRKLMEQASHMVLEYNQTGLSGVGHAIDFLLDKARLNFDEAMVSLYAFDCNEAEKIKIPENITCSQHKVKPEKKVETDHLIFSKLKANQALAGDLCSAILAKPKSEFTAGECGNHALGVIGMKCIDGKYQYLIQNSWGKDNKAKNPAITTEADKGSYWFDEQTFYDSFYNLSSF